MAARPDPRHAGAALAWLLPSLFGLTLSLGCQGGGHLQLAALAYDAIDLPEGPPPGFFQLDLGRCYWWMDAANHVWVVMERDQPSLFFGEVAHMRVQFALALGEPPAGRYRDYRIGRRELRGLTRLGPARGRWSALTGIVVLYKAPGDRLRGSFRLEAMREVQQLLGSWSRPNRFLLMGTFEAVRDEAAGRRIADEAESFGPPREPATSQPQPVTQPAPPTQAAAAAPPDQ